MGRSNENGLVQFFPMANHCLLCHTRCDYWCSSESHWAKHSCGTCTFVLHQWPMMLFMLVIQCLNVWIHEKHPAFCNHSNESCRADLSCSADYCVQTFGSVDEILEHVSIQTKAMQYFPVVWFIIFYIIVQVTVPWLFKHKLGYWLLVSFGSLYSLK